MKISIVTLYNSLNYGAFLQAYAFKKILNDYDMNYEVKFLKTKARKPIKNTLRFGLKKILLFRFKEAFFEFKKLGNFIISIRNNFSTHNTGSSEINKQDLFVFGSDEIWNISKAGVRDYPILFGQGLPDNNFASYAPSINTTTLEEIKESKNFQKSIQRFNRLSARDYHSLNTIKEITSKEVKIVLDPTFLLSKHTYYELEKECGEKDFILIYGYTNNFNQNKINEIKKFAESVNLKLISVGFYNSWCDKSVPASPFEFLSYIKNAEYVITSTFHGTIFSIIYNKQFVTYAEKKVKINDLLQRLSLENRNVSHHTGIEDIITEKIPYNKIENSLKDEVQSSFSYIDSFISDVK